MYHVARRAYQLFYLVSVMSEPIRAESCLLHWEPQFWFTTSGAFSKHHSTTSEQRCACTWQPPFIHLQYLSFVAFQEDTPEEIFMCISPKSKKNMNRIFFSFIVSSHVDDFHFMCSEKWQKKKSAAASGTGLELRMSAGHVFASYPDLSIFSL